MSTSTHHDVDDEEGRAKHSHRPPLSSLIQPHLHSILVIATEHGLPEPSWTAGKPEEKRSLSSDKTITPSSSSTINASSSRSHSGDERSSQGPLPKHRAMQSSSSSGKKSLPSSPARPPRDVPDVKTDLPLTPLSHSNTVVLSPASEQAHTSLSGSPPKKDSGGSSPSSHSSSKRVSDPKTNEGKSSKTRTDNELWIQVSDCLKVVADALRDDKLRGPLGQTSFIIHLLTLFSLTMTHQGTSYSSSTPKNAAQALRSHKGISSALSSTLESVAHMDGLAMAQTQCLRSLANLCIDNDDNRSELIAHDMPLFVLRLVQNILRSSSSIDHLDSSNLLLLKTAMGALLNLQLDHSESRRWLLKLPPAGSKRFARHQNGGNEEGLTEEDHRAAHPSWHNPNFDRGRTDLAKGESGGGPFHLPEAGTILTLVEVATDPRIYSSAFALRSILGQDSKEEGQNEWRPPSGQWDLAELGAEVASWAARIVEDLLQFELEQAKVAQGSGEGVDTSMLTLPSKVALADDERTCDWLLRSLRGYSPAQGNSSSTTSSSHLDEPDSDGPDDASCFLDADLTVLSLSAELLEACTNIFQGNAPAAVRFKRNGLSKLDDLLTFVDRGTNPFGTHIAPPAGLLEQYGLELDDVTMMAKEVSKAKTNAVKAVVSIVGEDENMSELFGAGGNSPFFKQMKAWLQKDRTDREDLVSCALLSIANLARSDENCVSLVKEHDLVPLLVSLLEGESSMLLSHATLGLLKNLCIPPPNKATIGASGIFVRLPSFMLKDKDHAQPIQFASVGIAKHLAYCSSESMEQNVAALCKEGGPAIPSTLEAILDLIERTEDTPTKLEATRVLVNVVRTLWASSSVAKTQGSVDLTNARRAIGQKRVIAALCYMLKRGGKYPILLNEAIVALTLLASTEGAERAGVIATSLIGQHADGSVSDGVAKAEDGEKAAINSPEEDLLGRAPPARSSTMDSMMSTFSSATATATPDNAADVLYEVLSHAASKGDKDGRDVPIEFAENTCTLLSTLIGGRSIGEATKDLSIKLLPALRGLKARTSSLNRETTSKAIRRALESCEGAIKSS